MSVNLKTTWQAPGLPETAKWLQFENVFLPLRANISRSKCINEKCLKYKQARKNLSSSGCPAEPASVPRPWLALCEDGGLGAAAHALRRQDCLGDMDGSQWCG